MSLENMVDIHTHILPHVDDGPDSFVLTLEMIRKEYADGVRHIIVTPHYRIGMFEPDMNKIFTQYSRLVRSCASYKDLRISLGCEFHANSAMIDILNDRARPTMAGTNCVLVEFRGSSTLEFIRERCIALQNAGYMPIIAHAERYKVLRQNIEYLQLLVDEGNLIQMNAASILGDDGWLLQRYCNKAISRNLVTFVASDTHNMTNRYPLMGEVADYIEKKHGRAKAEQLLCKTAAAIFRDNRDLSFL